MVCQGLSEKTVAKYQLQYEVKNWYKEYIVFSCGLSALFKHVDLVTTSLRAGLQVYLS